MAAEAAAMSYFCSEDEDEELEMRERVEMMAELGVPELQILEEYSTDGISARPSTDVRDARKREAVRLSAPPPDTQLHVVTASAPIRRYWQPQVSVTCYACGKMGHVASECPTAAGAAHSCYTCGRPGHMARECSGVVGQTPSPAPQSPQRRGVFCCNCGYEGHEGSQCGSPRYDEDVSRMIEVGIDPRRQTRPRDASWWRKYRTEVDIFGPRMSTPPPGVSHGRGHGHGHHGSNYGHGHSRNSYQQRRWSEPAGAVPTSLKRQSWGFNSGFVPKTAQPPRRKFSRKSSRS